MSRLQDIHRHFKSQVELVINKDRKNRNKVLQITTEYHPSHVVNVGKVTVENIVKHWGKDISSATGKTVLQQCVNSSYTCKWLDRKWDSQDEQRGDFFIKPISSENHTDEVYVNLKINHTLVKFKLDTGSQVNIIKEKNL